MSIVRFLLPLVLVLATCWARDPIFEDVEPGSFMNNINSKDFRLPDTGVTPENYEITLQPFFGEVGDKEKQFTFEGTVVITLTFKPNVQNIQEIILHGKDLNHVTAALEYDPKNGGGSNRISQNANVTLPNSTAKNDFITLFFKDKVPAKAGPYYLTLKYEGKLNDDLLGFYKSSYNDSKSKGTEWLATTQFEPVGARLAFPCWDEPAIKATFDITIKNSKDYFAISNMEKKSDKVDKKTGIRTTEFQRTPRMSTYLVAFVVSKFESSVNQKDNKFAVWTRPDAKDSAKYAAEHGKNILENLEKFTGFKYYQSKNAKLSMKMTKMDQISIPQFSAGAMENWGLVTYRESALLYTENVTTTLAKQDITTVISHEFSHQWFGNLVTPEWWEYIWLSEGFATFFQYFTTDSVINEDKKEESWRLMEQFVVKTLQESAFVTDGTIHTRKMNQDVATNDDIINLFDNIAYKKAASVIRMMQHFMTKDLFQEGLKEYLKSEAGKSATPKKLFKAMHDQFKDKKSSINVTEVMETWVNQAGYPVVKVEKNKDGEVTFKQERFFLTRERPSKKDKKPTWHIPINYVTEKTITKVNNTEATHWMTNAVDKKGNSETLTIKPDAFEWIIVNNLQTGFYRVNYDKDNWERLAKYLKDHHKQVAPVTRAQLIDDSLNLARGGYLSYDIALQNTFYLEKETDYIPWYAAARAFNYLDRMLQNMENYDIFQKYIAQRINKLVDTVGFKAPKGDTHILKLSRVLALTTACRFDLEACQKYAEKELENWLKNENNVPTDMREGVLCAGLRHASQSTWNKTLDKYKRASEDKKEMILNSLACSQSNDTLRIFLEESLNSKELDIFKTLDTICMNNAKSFSVLIDFLNKNFDKIQEKDKDMKKITAHIDKLATVVISNEQYGQLAIFIERQLFRNNYGNNNVTFDGLKKGRENIDWVESSQKNISKWLTENYKENSATSFTAMTFLVIISMLISRFY